MPSLQNGTLIDAHRIVRHVADGGSAEVYEALGPSGRVAIKILRPELCGEAEVRARFVREGEHLAALSSRYLPRWRASGALLGRPFVAMDWADGRTLDVVLTEGPIALDVVMSGGGDLMLAVEAVHDAGLVHRDIKADNVMVHSARWALLDLGVAARQDESTSGPLMGAPRSWAPERLSGGGGRDRRSDLYSLALLLYLAIAREDPFAYGTPGWAERVANQPPPPLRAFRKEAAHLDGFFATALSKAPEDRFEAAGPMRDAWLVQQRM